MFQKQANNLIDSINKLERIREERHYLDAFRERQRKLEQLIDTITPSIHSYQLFQEYDIGNLDHLDSYMEQVRTLVISMRGDFVLKAEWIIEPQVLTELTRKVQYLKEMICRELQNLWDQYIDRHRPAIQEDLLNTLSGISNFREKITTIQLLLNNMHQLKKVLPNNKDDIDAIANISSSISREWVEMGAFNIPDDVRFFLQQTTSSSGAGLSAYTETVRLWLETHQLLSHFSIRTLSY